MPKIVKCPSCQEKIDVTDLSGGSTVRCEACGTMVRLASGATGRVPQATPPPPPPPPAPARKERGTTKMHKKEKGTGVREKGTGVRTNPGRQTDLFRKMSNAKAPGEGGRPRGGGGGKEAQGNNTGMIIAIAAGVIVILGGAAFALMHKSEPEPAKSSSSKEKDANAGTKKKKRDDAPAKSSTPPPVTPAQADTFKPGARAISGAGKDVPDMRISPEAKAQYETMVSGSQVAEVVAGDAQWIKYVFDGLLSDNEAVAKGSMAALHDIIKKRGLPAKGSDLENAPIIRSFNSPEIRAGEYTFWATWWYTRQAQEMAATWGSSGGGSDPATPRPAAANLRSDEWRETLMKCRSGGFSNSANPEYYEYQRIKGMGKAAYPKLIEFIDDEELGTTAVLILKELSGRSDAPSRVTAANKAKIKEDWEGWLRSGP